MKFFHGPQVPGFSPQFPPPRLKGASPRRGRFITRVYKSAARFSAFGAGRYCPLLLAAARFACCSRIAASSASIRLFSSSVSTELGRGGGRSWTAGYTGAPAALSAVGVTPTCPGDCEPVDAHDAKIRQHAPARAAGATFCNNQLNRRIHASLRKHLRDFDMISADDPIRVVARAYIVAEHYLLKHVLMKGYRSFAEPKSRRTVVTQTVDCAAQ